MFQGAPAISLGSQESKVLFSGSPQQLLKQGAPNDFVVESSIVIGFQEAPIISLGSPQRFCSLEQRQYWMFQGAPAISLGSQESKDLFSGSPHHFFREPPTFLQLRLLLLFDFRKPPSFLQGAPNILYLRVASLLDVLGSPRHFSRYTRVKSFVCREPPTIVGIGSPQHFCT